jgi:hypothetical protein
MIELVQQITRSAAAFEVAQAEALITALGGGVQGIVAALVLAWSASLAIMLLGTLARLRS